MDPLIVPTTPSLNFVSNEIETTGESNSIWVPMTENKSCPSFIGTLLKPPFSFPMKILPFWDQIKPISQSNTFIFYKNSSVFVFTVKTLPVESPSINKEQLYGAQSSSVCSIAVNVKSSGNSTS